MIADGRAHFADHCAVCHANDGSGQTAIGQGLWPKAPDMRQGRTQNLTDGELFWTIENGIRFTGMPAWSTGTQEGEQASWNLVHFIRRMPKLTPEDIKEMESLNPKSPAEVREEMEAEILKGGGKPAAKPAMPHSHKPGRGHEYSPDVFHEFSKLQRWHRRVCVHSGSGVTIARHRTAAV